MPLSVRAALTPPKCADDGIGRQVGLKNRRRKACGFESHSAHQYASLAQTAEQQTFNLWVAGSIPSRRTKCRCGAIGRRIRFKIGSSVGSKPSICTKYGEGSSVGRAPGCGPEGRRFESAHAPHTGECRSLVKRDGL